MKKGLQVPSFPIAAIVLPYQITVLMLSSLLKQKRKKRVGVRELGFAE